MARYPRKEDIVIGGKSVNINPKDIYFGKGASQQYGAEYLIEEMSSDKPFSGNVKVRRVDDIAKGYWLSKTFYCLTHLILEEEERFMIELMGGDTNNIKIDNIPLTEEEMRNENK